MKILKNHKNSLTYSDVFIVPQYSDIQHREDIDLSSQMNGITIPIPIISANMETVSGHKMCKAMRRANALGALHRFHESFEETSKEFLDIQGDIDSNLPVIVSAGVNFDWKEKSKKLHELGARYFVIDIAHGHSRQMREMIEYMKEELSSVYIIAGNVATRAGTLDLFRWGADCVKIIIAGGSVCITKNVTGVVVPTFSSVLECASGAAEWKSCSGKEAPIIADGGFVEIGDMAKALGAGADFVMSGKFFAGCDEAPLETLYQGSASYDAQIKYRDGTKPMPTPEGKKVLVEKSGPVARVVEEIASGLRSSFSYSNARNMQEFHENCQFGVRYSNLKK